MEDSAPMPLQRRAGDHQGLHRYFRFDPTLSTGSLLQLATFLMVFAIGYGTYTSDRTQTKADIEQLREGQKTDRANVKEVVEQFRSDLKDIKADTKDIGLKIAEIKGQQQGKK